ncbi:hydroxymethylglutaryl-CoA lyase [Rhodococcus ruber]|uniref:hydroxymethylglutaryl-CoA lyase n=1 Tax=Rhodococcus ruber TaxID=1830 RepID=UPI000F543B98|nr:hydroxymethylglutaryl-CoA lyase [Rhodococcus ruber]RQM35331.1 hydroxymethylglutaryl-CoA lyase [Rhodococcus ruber]
MAVTITDVVLRDGLQDEKVVVDTGDKIRIAAALARAGLTQLEVASFVSPTRVPQMADADAVIAGLPRTDPSVHYSALALNATGVYRAAASDIDEIQIVASAGTGHSRANSGRTPEQALAELAEAVRAHPDRRFIAGISTAFVCPFDGPISADRLVEVAVTMADMGVVRLGLADTLGTASTEHVLDSVAAVRAALPDTELSLHLHNADGQAIGTALAAAIDLGIEHFDAALGGYGGCPFAPGAHGNLATEVLVRHFHHYGIDTGIDESALTDAATTLAHALDRARPLTAA